MALRDDRQILTDLVSEIKLDISDEYRAFEDDEEPGIQLTVGSNENGDWAYQTGDNAYSGGAYNYPYWGVVGIYQDTDADEAVDELMDQIVSQTQ